MHNPLNQTAPSCPTQPRPKHQQTETLRPFVQKYQYQQLPLPEPCSLAEADASTEQPATDLGKQPCAAPCHKNS